MEYHLDEKDKLLFKNILLKRGFRDIYIPPYKFLHYDVCGTYKGKMYYFELKKRPFSSTLYGDTICEKAKFNTPDVNCSYIVGLFTDCFTVIPLTEDYVIKKMWCQKTNNWDREKVLKDIYSYKNKEKYKYRYEDY